MYEIDKNIHYHQTDQHNNLDSFNCLVWKICQIFFTEIQRLPNENLARGILFFHEWIFQVATSLSHFFKEANFYPQGGSVPSSLRFQITDKKLAYIIVFRMVGNRHVILFHKKTPCW